MGENTERDAKIGAGERPGLFKTALMYLGGGIQHQNRRPDIFYDELALPLARLARCVCSGKMGLCLPLMLAGRMCI